MTIEHNVSLDYNPLPVWICDEATKKVLDVNKAAIQEFGFSESEWIGTFLNDKLPDLSELRNDNSSGVMLRAKNGDVHTLDVRSSVIGTNGKAIRFIIGYPSAHMPRREETFLSFRGHHLEEAITQASIISITNTKGEIIYVNENFARLSGYTDAELIGKDYCFISSPRHTSSFWDGMWDTVGCGNTWRAEVLNQAKDGSAYWIETFATAMCGSDGIVQEYLFISTDITQRKKSEESKAETVAQLRNAMRFAKQGAVEYDVTRDEITISDELLELLEDNGTADTNKLSLGEFLRRYILPEDHNFIIDKIHKGVGDSVVADTKIRIDFRVRTAKGAIRSINALGTFKDGGKVFAIFQDVSDHKRALDESMEKSKQIEDILQSITDGFFAVDRDLKFTLVNPLFEYLVGLRGMELIGKDARELFPNLTKSSLDQVMQALRTSRPCKFEFTNLINQDQIFDVHVYPNHTGLFVYFQDISERKRNERKLIDSENKIKAFFNSTTDVNFLLDPDHNILAFNRAGADFIHKVFRKTVREGDNIIKFIAPESIDGFRHGFVDALTGTTSSQEIEIAHTPRMKIWWQITFSPAINSRGQINGVVFNATNIDTRKRAEHEARKLSLIARHTSNAVILTDQNGMITWVNEGFERITEYHIAEVIGKKPGDILQGPNSSKETMLQMREHMKQREPFRVEILNYTKSGRECWLEIEVIPLKNESGEITGFIAVEVDITPLKNAIAELLKTQELLRAIVENAPMDVFVKDQGGRYIFFNKSFERKFPLNHRRSVVTDYDLFPLNRVLKEQEQDLTVMRTGEMIRQEEDRQNTTSEETYYTVKFPLYDNDQQTYAVGGIALDITERRQMEKTLRESRERIGIALNASQVCTWDWDITNNKIHWEGDVESVLGLKIDNLQTYESFLELVHPDDRAAVNENVIHTLQEKEDFDAEFRIVRKDGKICWMMGAGKVVFDEENRPARMVGINKDITERRNIEDKIRESEQRFRQMADHSPSFIWLTDQDGQVIYLNKAWYEFIGGSPETELGDGWLRHVHPQDLESLGNEFVIASEKRIAFSIEYRVRRKDGEYRWVMESGAPRYLENGDFLGYIGSCIDMTERKQIEAALKKSEALYRSVIQTQREMICRYTPDSTLTFVNDAFCATVGKPREELIGRSLVEFLPRGNHLKVLSMNVPGTGEPERIVLPNGEMRWHEWTDHPLYDHFGHVSEIQSVGTDVTDRVEADLEVNRISTRLLLATHAANLGIWEWTVNTGTSIWDKKMYEIFGLDPQYTGSPDDHWIKCIHPDDRVASQRAIGNALSGNSDYEFEYRIMKPGSGLRFLNSYGIVQHGPDGKPTAIIGVTWDNTERKLSEIALQQSEKRFRTLVENLSVGILVQNANFDIILANQAILSLMGISEVEMLSRTSADARWRLIREDGSPLPIEEHPAAIALATDTNVKNRIVGVYREAFGDQIWLMVDAVPFRDKTGDISQVTVTCIDITARVLAEKALRARGKQMKELTDRLTLATTAAHLGIWDYNPRTDELLWDNTMFEIFGKEKEIVSNVDIWVNALHPDDRQAQVQLLKDAFAKEELVYNTEFKIVRETDGAVRYIKALGTINRDAQHAPVQMVGVNWDITEQKQKEEEIRNSEARYRSIVDGQREMICRYTSSGVLTFANKSYLDAFGIISEETANHSYLDLFPDSYSALVDTMMRGLFGGETYPDPIEFQTDVRGHMRWMKWINIPLRNSDGDVYEVQAIGQDITERKELEAQQARLDKIVRESYNEIYLFNAVTLQFEFANASALDNLGYSISQLTSMKITDLFHYPNEMAMQILLKTLRSGETDRLQLQMKHRRKDGTYYDIETLIQVFEKDQSFVAIVTDITQKLVTEKKLLATIQEKEILIKEIHHRVKNNLQLISSIIYIKMTSVKESEIKYFLGDMRQKIRSIALIHERLLQTENLDTVDISDYLGKLVYDLQTSNSRPDLNLRITSSLEKKQMDLDTAIYCALIVNELITNAIKHAFKGLAVGMVEVSFRQDGNEYVLGVSDNGITMPDTIAPGESNSFGMHLLEIFVRQLGGRLEVKRQRGTSFKIRFPKKK